MATGVSTKMKSSEETFDFTCSVCRKKNRVREAVKHCQECHKDLCTSCLEHHKEYLEDHTLVEPSAAGSVVVMPTEKCRHHGQRVVELWCKNHDEILCSTCVIMNHRSCESIKFISGNIDDLLQDTELQETINRLKSTRERLATLKDEQGLAEEELLNEKNKYLEMVEQTKKKIISIVESLEKAAVEEISVWYNERKSKVSEVQDCCNQQESDASSCIQELDLTSDNKSQLFVSMKKGQKVLKVAKEFAGKRDDYIKSDKEYKLNPDIENYLSTLQTLGSFQEQRHLYKATFMRKVKVKISKDKSQCVISDTCLLSDCSIMVADHKNRRLKRLESSTYTVIDHCDLPGHPWAVCCVGPQEVAVGLCYNNMIQFVTLNNPMSLSNSIYLDYWCRGLGYDGGKLFVSDAAKNLLVYSRSGSLLQTISQTQSGEPMFSLTRHLAISGDRVYIVDRDQGLICTDKNGIELSKYSGTQIQNGYGVCTDGQGEAFLCGFNSNNVVQVGSDGEELGVVLSQADGLKNPQSVCFDPSNQILIVTSDKSDEVLLFNLV